MAWGCAFAQVAFGSIWCFTPYMRLLSIVLHPFKKFMAIVLGGKKDFVGSINWNKTIYKIWFLVCMAPCMETIGLILSRIHVTQSQSDPPKPIEYA